MRIDKLKERVEEIRRATENPEVAHWLEDKLWEDVLVAISESVDNPEESAKTCLKTSKISFERWYAYSITK